jgi:large subunit ribosomal protein L4
MSTIPMVHANGQSAGEIEFSDELMCRGASRQLVREAVTMHRANQRAGTANTKSKSQIRCSNKKPWRQKGTGRARAGYRSSPVWRGGGVAFGPKPRSYRKKMTRKAARKAFALAVAERVDQGAVIVVDRLEIDQPKTKALAGQLKSMGMPRRGLVVVAAMDQNLALASRNLPDIDVVTVAALSTYDVMRHARMLLTRDALTLVEERMRKAAGKGET